jgi:hypothetical protein
MVGAPVKGLNERCSNPDSHSGASSTTRLRESSYYFAGIAQKASNAQLPANNMESPTGSCEVHPGKQVDQEYAIIVNKKYKAERILFRSYQTAGHK